MSKDVFANGMAIVCKAGDAKVVAAFPSVCQSPPGPPSGPLPVPYPLSSFSRDLKRGSKRVKIGGKPVALHGQSFYQSKPLGNEAATRSFGASIVTHQIAGKTQFSSGSMDVEFEGKRVCRHLDMTTSNHGSAPGEGPSPGLETMAVAGPDVSGALDRCPCCKGPLHANQFDPETKVPYEPVDELEWYEIALDYHKKKVGGIGAFMANKPGWAKQIDPNTGLPNQAKIENAHARLEATRQDYDKLVVAQAEDPPCENLANEPEDQGCRTYLKKTNPEPQTSKPEVRRELGFTDSVKTRCIRLYRTRGRKCRSHSEICHKTPLAAGGCPTRQENLIPKDVLSNRCAAVDDTQTRIQGLAAELHTK